MLATPKVCPRFGPKTAPNIAQNYFFQLNHPPAPAEQVPDLVVGVVLLQRVEDHLGRPPQRPVGVHGDERGQEEAVALPDGLLVAGVGQVLLERQDGRLLHHGRLDVLGPDDVGGLADGGGGRREDELGCNSIEKLKSPLTFQLSF